MVFCFSDGTEAFRVRARVNIVYVHQNRHPTISAHYVSVLLGVYYAHTPLGRPVLRGVDCEELSFYPVWLDSAGYMHDTADEEVVSVNGSIPDGEMFVGTALVDPFAVSNIVIMIGGAFVFRGLTLVLADGTSVRVTDGRIVVSVEKWFNDDRPLAGNLSGVDLEYSSDSRQLTVALKVAAPALTVVDSVIAAGGLLGVVVIILTLILYRRGHIEHLPLIPWHRSQTCQPTTTTGSTEQTKCQEPSPTHLEQPLKLHGDVRGLDGGHRRRGSPDLC